MRFCMLIRIESLCVGVKILGNVYVGTGSIVAANAVVIKDDPENELKEKPQK